jgi:cleavage and polyadenylation specificity factor subunit 1
MLLRCGQVLVYRIVATSSMFIEGTRESTLQIAFVRVLSTLLEPAPLELLDKRGAPAQRHLIPFTAALSGVFLTGNRPIWICATNQSPVRITPAASTVVHAFAACSVWGSRTEFLVHTDEVCLPIAQSGGSCSHYFLRAHALSNGHHSSNCTRSYRLSSSHVEGHTPA